VEQGGDFYKNGRGEWRVLLICPKAELRDMVLGGLTGLGVRDVIQMTTYPERYGLDSVVAGRQICLIDVSSDQFLALPLLERIAAENVSVITLHANQDPEVQLQCLRRGVSESLAVPIDPGQLQYAFDRVAARRQYETRLAQPPGAVYAVMSGKGGAGSTTIATHLALCLTDACPRKTLLVDVDGITGSIAFALRAKPAFSLLDVPADLGRMDEDLWNNLLAHQGRLDLLLAPESPRPLQIRASQLPQLVDFWRTLYGAVVLDLPGSHHELSLGLALHADLLLLISTCDLGSVYATARKSAYLESFGVRPGAIKIVLNRFRSTSTLESWNTVGERPVFAHVSDAGDALQKVLLDGKVMPARSKFGMDISTLARQLTGSSSISAPSNRTKHRVIKSGVGFLSQLSGALRPKPLCVLAINGSDQNSPPTRAA
jgi:pilus assembly protein CpaE